MSNEEIRKVLENLPGGTILSYLVKEGTIYLIVSGVSDGKVMGQLAGANGVNGVAIEKLLEMEGLSLVSRGDFRGLESEVVGGVHETRTVQLTVRLPNDIAAQAEEMQKTDPEFLSSVVMYGLTRRSILRHLKEQAEAAEGEDYST